MPAVCLSMPYLMSCLMLYAGLSLTKSCPYLRVKEQLISCFLWPTVYPTKWCTLLETHICCRCFLNRLFLILSSTVYLILRLSSLKCPSQPALKACEEWTYLLLEGALHPVVFGVFQWPGGGAHILMWDATSCGTNSIEAEAIAVLLLSMP